MNKVFTQVYHTKVRKLRGKLEDYIMPFSCGKCGRGREGWQEELI